MLGQRLRRWPSIKPTLVQRIVLTGESCNKWTSSPHTSTFTSINPPIWYFVNNQSKNSLLQQGPNQMCPVPFKFSDIGVNWSNVGPTAVILAE